MNQDLNNSEKLCILLINRNKKIISVFTCTVVADYDVLLLYVDPLDNQKSTVVARYFDGQQLATCTRK